MSDVIAIAASLPVGLINRCANGGMLLCPEGTQSAADGESAFIAYTVLTQSGAIQTSQLSNPAGPNMARAMRLVQSQASAQRFGICQTIQNADCQDLRDQQLNTQHMARFSADGATMFALLEWDGTADASPADPINDWTSSQYIPGQFFKSSFTVLNVGRLRAEAEDWRAAPYLWYQAGASLTNLVYVIWTEEAQAQNAFLDISLVQVAQGAEPQSFEHRPLAVEEAEFGLTDIIPIGAVNGRTARAWVSDVVNIAANWGGGYPVGDGDNANADADTAAFAAAAQAAADLGKPLYIPAPLQLVLNAQTQITDQSLTVICAPGAKIIQFCNEPVLRLFASFTNAVTISAIDNAALIDLSDGTVGDSTVARLTVSSTANYAIGQNVKVYSDDVILGGNGTNEREGEMGRVSAIDAGNNYIYLYAPLVFASRYTTNPRVAIMNSEPEFRLQGLTLDLDPDSDPDWAEPVLEIVGAYNPQLIDILSKSSQSGVIWLIGCLDDYSENVHCIDARTDTTLPASALGYGIIELSCEHGLHRGMRGCNVRHLYTTGVLSSATNTTDSYEIAKHGRTKYFDICDGEAWNCQRAAFDTHPDAYAGVIRDCHVTAPYVGPSGAAQCFAVRGLFVELRDCTALGGNVGYSLVAQFDNDSLNDTLVTNCTHTHYVGAVETDVSFQVEGPPSGSTRRNRYIDCISNGNGSLGTAFKVEDGQAYVQNMLVRQSPTAAGTVRAFQKNTDGILVVRGARIDYNGATTATLFPFYCNNSNGGSIEASGIDITAGVSTVAAIVSAGGSTDAGVYVQGITSLAPTALFDGTFSGTSWIDFASSPHAQNLGITETYTIASGVIGPVREHYIRVATQGGAGTDDLDTINGGDVGDLLYIRCAANTVVIKNATGNIFCGSDRTLSSVLDTAVLLKTASSQWVLVSYSDNAA